MAVTTPTTNKLLLRHTVRRFRELSGLTQVQLGERAYPHLSKTDARSKIAQIEQGQRVPRGAADLKAIIDVLNAALVQAEHPAIDEVVARDMEEMRKNASRRGRWTDAKPVLEGDIRTLVDLEKDADIIRVCGSEYFPGYLQGPEYARALFSTNKEKSPEDIDASVQTRLSRSDIFLRGKHRTQLNAVLSQSCLERFPGVATRQTMLHQLDYLIQLSHQSNITIQIIPFQAPSTGSIALRPREFTLLHIPAPGLAGALDIGSTEEGFEVQLNDDKEGVAALEKAWGILTATALSPHDSLRFIDNQKIQFS